MKQSTRRIAFAAPVAGALGVALLAPVSPAQAQTCSTATWKTLEEAHEIINMQTLYEKDPWAAVPTYKADNSNGGVVVPDDWWNGTSPYTSDNAYKPPSPFVKNTTRLLEFNESKFLASPDNPMCDTAHILTDPQTDPVSGQTQQFSWGAMSLAVNAMWPFDRNDYPVPPNLPVARKNAFYAGNWVTTPPPGVVKVTANFKAQDMKFWANEDGVAPGTPGAQPLTRFFIKDQWGNKYIMHASNASTPETVQQAFDAAVLPEGWTKLAPTTLQKDLILKPAQGKDGEYGSFHYLVFRDSADNTYHQITWSDKGQLEAQVDGSAMPIWGGQDDNTIPGNNRSSTMHGAAGDDLLKPMKGADDVWGDAGTDTVKLQGKARTYTLVDLDKTDKMLQVSRGGVVKTINWVEKLKFSDQTIKVKKLKGKNVGKAL